MLSLLVSLHQLKLAQQISLLTTPSISQGGSGNYDWCNCSSSGLSTGAIIGIAIGSVVLVVIIIIVIVCCVKKRNQDGTKNP